MSQDRLQVPSYRKPPIIEAVWSVQFTELSWMLAPHTGLFWGRIKDRFPACEEHAPIAHVLETEDVFAPQTPHAELLPTPPLSRQWFVSDSGNELIQLQRDRLCCNWRRVEAADEYPRFEHMRSSFQLAWETFRRFVADMGQPPPVVDQCEMTYINHIDQGQVWEVVEQVDRVFPAVGWKDDKSFLNPPKTIGARFVFDMPELRGRLHVSLRHGVRTDEDSGKRQLFLLELIARGAPQESDISGLLAWFGMARESIVRGFTDLTSPDMHELWERER